MENFTAWEPITATIPFPQHSAIYVLRNVLTGMEYVGQASDLRKRLTVHRCAKSSNSALHRAIVKYGKNNFNVCYASVPTDLLNTVESSVIVERNTVSPNGYNLTEGGDGTRGWKHSEATKLKISAANTGKQHSQETKERLAKLSTEKAANRTFRHTPETKAKMKALRNLRGPVSEEARERMRISHLGHEISDTTRQKLAESSRGRIVTESTKKAIAKALIGTTLGENHRLKLRERNLGKKLSEETRAKMSAATERHNNTLQISFYVWEADSLTPLIFYTLEEAAAHSGVSQSAFREWCRTTPSSYRKIAVAKLYVPKY